jgi:hypothetical protein
MGLWILLGAAAGYAAVRVFWGYPAPQQTPRVLSRRELALLTAAAEAVFPPGGAIPISGAEAGVAAYTDRWLSALPPRIRLLMRLLFFLIEHGTLVFPAPRPRGFRRFSSLSREQAEQVLEGWRTSRLFPRRLVFTSLRAIVAMGFFAHPGVLRHLGLAPRRIETPVCEADLLYPPIGRGPEAIPYTRADLARPRESAPLSREAPLHPAYAGDGA